MIRLGIKSEGAKPRLDLSKSEIAEDEDSNGFQCIGHRTKRAESRNSAIRPKPVKGEKTFSNYGYVRRELGEKSALLEPPPGASKRFRSKYWKHRDLGSTYV
jgi:hypothetical protein